MPAENGTGPWGLGPMTGRGLGFCAPDVGNLGMEDLESWDYPSGWGLGRRWGLGWGRGWGPHWGRRWAWQSPWFYPSSGRREVIFSSR